MDVYHSIVDLQGPEARAGQTEMKVRSMQLTLEAALINGDATPSCSHGATEAIQLHGRWRGCWLLHHRVARCHRCHPGGYDPVPPVADQPKPLPAELR